MINSPVNLNRHKVEIAMGFKVFSDDLSTIPLKSKKARVINTISPNSYGLSTKDTALKQALQSSDYLVLDGVYFALASIFLRGRNIKRNQGPDVFYHFMKRLNNRKGKAFFLGSTTSTLNMIKQQAKNRYPNIKVYSYSPAFASSFSPEQEVDILDAINKVKPDIVFVGMTCPKQEIWSVKNRDKIDTGLIISIGNVFDWFAGTQQKIHPIWFTLRMAWLVRIFLRPEIFKRNIGNQLTFFRHLFYILIGMRKEPTYLPV